jgi:MFS family permease
LFLPGSFAIVPALLPESDLQEGNALASAATQLSGLIGPAIGGAIVAAISVQLTFAIDAVSFAISALSLARIRALHESSRTAGNFPGLLEHGMRIEGSSARAAASVDGADQPVTLRHLIASPDKGATPPLVRPPRRGCGPVAGMIELSRQLAELVAQLVH